MLPKLNQSFEFKASSFEEYCSGACTNKGASDVTIKASVSSDAIHFTLQGNLPRGIRSQFRIPLGNQVALGDRLQYGDLPGFNWNGFASDSPLVCNMFYNGTCIRFAMVNPLRIIEFTGEYV